MSQNLKQLRLVDATFEDFENFLDEYLSKKKADETEREPQKLRGLKMIAQVLDISTRTLSRLRKETSIFDGVINQKGKIITADKNDLQNIKISDNENKIKKH